MKSRFVLTLIAAVAFAVLLTPNRADAAGCCCCTGADCTPNPQCTDTVADMIACQALCELEGLDCEGTTFNSGITCVEGCGGAWDTPTPTPTETPIDTPTDTPTETPTETNTPTVTPTATPTGIWCACAADPNGDCLDDIDECGEGYAPDCSVADPNDACSGCACATDTPTPTDTPTDTPTETHTATPTNTPTETDTPTETPTDTPTITPTPTNTPTSARNVGMLMYREVCSTPTCISTRSYGTQAIGGTRFGTGGGLKTVHVNVELADPNDTISVQAECQGPPGQFSPWVVMGSALTASGKIEEDAWCEKIRMNVTAQTCTAACPAVSAWVAIDPPLQ